VKTCTECGTEFHARADAAYCSTACRQRAYRHRNANRNVPSAVGAGVPVAATIGSLISESDRITSELEKHTADMNYPGTDEFNAHTFPRHPFDDSAYEVLHDLAERMEQVSNDLYSAEEERQSYAALTPQQKTARTQELEEIAEDAEASAGRETEWERGGAARETAWAALPPELTAPGRCHESVKRCGQCGGRVETINGIHRCWACFRRSQDGCQPSAPGGRLRPGSGVNVA
jgi:hypothetical protein